ncbi:MAG: hypothetical protein ACOC1O_00825 [bacterium]
MKKYNSAIDLRIEYKLQTGEDPIHPKYRNGEDIKENNIDFLRSYRGNPKTEYGRWLESFFENPSEIRDLYKSMYPENRKPVRIKKDWRNGRMDIYAVQYSLWLEEKILTEKK